MMFLEAGDLQALGLTLRLALTTTLVLIMLGTPLAWWLSRSRSPLRGAVSALVALPLVLPPTVIGFYLLVTLGPQGWFGARIAQLTGEALTFRFEGLLIASILYSLPFVIQPLQLGFESIPERTLEAASSLGAGRWDRFLSVVLPMSRSSYATAAVMGFAHTVGEFGVVLMVGGNIPGRTRVVSVAIYDHVESLNYASAHRLAAILLIFSFGVLWLMYGWVRPRRGPV